MLVRPFLASSLVLGAFLACGGPTSDVTAADSHATTGSGGSGRDVDTGATSGGSGTTADSGTGSDAPAKGSPEPTSDGGLPIDAAAEGSLGPISDGGPPVDAGGFSCGPKTCTSTQYCRETAGSLLDGGFSDVIECVDLPGLCANQPSCSCVNPDESCVCDDAVVDGHVHLLCSVK
jgi:hypothetical protein